MSETHLTKRKWWWDKRTKVEKFSIFIITLCTIAIIYLASNLFMKFPTKEEFKTVCMSPKCIQTSAKFLSAIDPKVNPCDDFYKFACGNFIKNTIIPDDKSSVTPITNLNDEIMSKLREIIEQPILPTDPKHERLVKTIYQSCMNTSKIEAESLEYFQQKFKEFGGWPVLLEYANWVERNFDWKHLLYRFRRAGWRNNFFFNLGYDFDPRNSSRKILTITQPCIDSRVVGSAVSSKIMKANHKYLTSLAQLFGAYESQASEDIQNVINFKLELSKIQVPKAKQDLGNTTYNFTTIRQLQRNFTTIPWLELLNNYLQPYQKVDHDVVIQISSAKHLQSLENLLLKTRKRTLANYMFLQVVLGSINFLPERFRAKQADFWAVVTNRTAPLARWRTCLVTASRLPVAVSAIYVNQLFDQRLQHKATELVLDLKWVLIDTLKKIGWMDRKTKKYAIQKAERMQAQIAFPFEILGREVVDRNYEELELNMEENFMELIWNITLFERKQELDDFYYSEKNDWRYFGSSLSWVNAYYLIFANTIELPAAILQPPFFAPDRPQYLNYGALGAIVGHEMTHGFDSEGRHFDAAGARRNWWQPETSETFARKSRCLRDQYGNRTARNDSGALGEDIADNGGIKLGYRAYLRRLERAGGGERALPGLGSYTARQMFWIAAAGVWCQKGGEGGGGWHAPNHERVMVPFMNSDYFARDFNCKLGSGMNPKYKCRVW